MVSWKRCGSCITMPTAPRSDSSVRSRTSWPSTRTSPALTSWMRGTSSAVVVLPAPDGPTSATSSPGATVKLTSRRIQSLSVVVGGDDASSSDAIDDTAADGWRNHTWSNLTRPSGSHEVERAGPLGDERREVEHLEDALERHDRGHHVDARVRELRERLVDLADVHDERGDGADRDRAADHEVAADEVHDRGADRGDEAERDEQHARVHRGRDADVADAPGAVGEVVATRCRGSPNSFTTSAPADVEALGDRCCSSTR